jgi:hypothetical protein
LQYKDAEGKQKVPPIRPDDADTLNLSYGGSTSSDDTDFARFWDAVVDDLGVPSTISAGNDGPSAYTLGDPSIAYNVLCVANMDDQNTTSRSDDTIRNNKRAWECNQALLLSAPFKVDEIGNLW